METHIVPYIRTCEHSAMSSITSYYSKCVFHENKHLFLPYIIQSFHVFIFYDLIKIMLSYI